MLSIASETSLVFFLVFISGCVTLPAIADRYAAADRFSVEHGFKKSFIKTGPFTLTAYYRLARMGAPIHIYIEGDGVSWVTRTQLSDDPTPYEPMVLQLAAIDSAENVAYIARPGQYSFSGMPDCDPSYWSDKRFSPEVVGSVNEVISRLAGQAGTKKVHLIGYSGGAAIVVLAAARRNDIASITTIAGNLDPGVVNRLHHVSPLEGSLDPMDVTEKIKNIPQHHFVGSKDTIVPLWVAQSFLRKQGAKDYRQIIMVDGVSHTAGWQEHWKELQKVFNKQ